MKAFEVREVYRNSRMAVEAGPGMSITAAPGASRPPEVPQCLNSRGNCARFVVGARTRF
jgi:hypothetical protein